MDNFDYTPNEINSEIFISEMPITLMKENIKAQFNNPLEHRKKDHITSFINMYRYSRDNCDVYDDEEKDNIIQLREEFYAFMLQMFEDYLGIGICDFEDMSEEDQDDIIHFTYRFFLMNIKKNFVSYVLNYIDRYKSSFINDDEKKRDVTTLSFKKEITDPEDMNIITNLSDIIDNILNDDIDIDEFFEYCDDDKCLETRFVSDAFDKFKITGNFIPHYVDMLDIDFKSSIESKVRNKILKKYKNK